MSASVAFDKTINFKYWYADLTPINQIDGSFGNCSRMIHFLKDDRFFWAEIVNLNTPISQPEVVETEKFLTLEKLLQAYNWWYCDTIRLVPILKFKLYTGDIKEEN